MWPHTTAVAGSEAILRLCRSFRLPERSSIYLISTIIMARYTSSLRLEKGFSASSNSLCSPTSSTTQIEALFRALSLIVSIYVGPSQLLNVGPDKSNDTCFSYNLGDFGSRIKKNSAHEDVDLEPLFI